MTAKNQASPQNDFPCVLQVGFSGSRCLFGTKEELSVATEDDIREWEADAATYLNSVLDQFREQYLDDSTFLCGISSLAIGADFAFSGVMTRRAELHRIFLPQHLEDFLDGIGSKGPDFSDEEKAKARQHLNQGNVIQQVVVSSSADRHDRFRETNAQILKSSDLVIGMIRDSNGQGDPGGSTELLQRSARIGRPTLEIRAKVVNGKAQFTKRWVLPWNDQTHGPVFPDTLDGLQLETGNRIPESSEYIDALKEDSSYEARLTRKRFVTAAFWLIMAGVVATLFATGSILVQIANATSNVSPVATVVQTVLARGFSFGSILLTVFAILEIATLIFCWIWHLRTYSSTSVRQWANARVVSEISASTRALKDYPIELSYLFQLHLPSSFKHLLRTVNVLHLRSSKQSVMHPWQTYRDSYLLERIRGSGSVDDNSSLRTNQIPDERPQIPFFANRLRTESPKLDFFDGLFKSFLVLAIVFAFAKLIVLFVDLRKGTEPDLVAQFLSALTVVMPVFAVAALSWVGALDYQARVETFGESLKFLERQEKLIETAQTREEFDRLLVETELHLLSENASWYSRVANSGV